MSRPKLLMLDEPSMGLAPMLIQQIFDIITEISQQGTTILVVEQNAKQALSRSDRAYVLETGRIVKTGTGAELLDDPVGARGLPRRSLIPAPGDRVCPGRGAARGRQGATVGARGSGGSMSRTPVTVRVAETDGRPLPA